MANCWIPKSAICHWIFFILIFAGVSSGRYTWSFTDEWSSCSKKCGNGEENNGLECVKNTLYGTKELVVPEKCSKIKKPSNTRKCFMGSCPTSSNGSFVWISGNWTQCSRACGGLALKNREVSCFHMTSKGHLLPSKLSKCNSKVEPQRFISCAKTDCPPKFLASKWGKCPTSKNCGRSLRRRNVQCVSLLKDGKLKVISAAFCYRIHLKPLSSWAICSPDNNAHCKNMTDLKRISASVVKIENDDAEVYQMRSVKRLQLSVGQTAYVFTYTKLSINCPMDGFPHSHIKWTHNKDGYHYQGDTSSRIRVNRRGTLIIQEFLLKDVGIWRCHAGKSSAHITLKHELPSNGFHNWLKRHSNHNYGMFNEESKAAFIMPDSLMWMRSDWSKCSLSCGSDDEVSGFQTRKVSCEKVEAKYYKIIDDKYCPHPRPMSKRKCTSTLSCPHWRVEKDNNEKCTDECVDLGIAKVNTNIYCEYETRAVDPSFCESVKRPSITCRNTKCQILYRYGPWSRCSLSCSNTSSTSIRSRTMQCIWQHDKQSAYNQCQHYNISHRPLVKACSVPKCILGCHDLTPACQNQSKYRCRSSLFYHFCCAFCRSQNFY